MSPLNLSVCRMQSRCDALVLKGMSERDTGRLLDVWLRGGGVSLGEAGLNPRGVILLPHNNLYSSRANMRGGGAADEFGGARNCRIAETVGFNRRGMKAKQVDLVLPCFNPEAVFRRCGLPMIRVNRHPTCLVESVFVNVGGLRQNAKVSTP